MQPHGGLGRPAPAVGPYMFGRGCLEAIKAKREGDPNWYRHVFTEEGLAFAEAANEERLVYHGLCYLEVRGCINFYTGTGPLYRAMGLGSPRFDSTDYYGGYGPLVGSTGKGFFMDLIVDMALHLFDKGGEELMRCKSFTTDLKVAEMFSNSRRGDPRMYLSPHSTDVLRYDPARMPRKPEDFFAPFFIDWREMPRTKLFVDGTICRYAVQNSEVLVVGGAPVRDIWVIQPGMPKPYRLHRH